MDALIKIKRKIWKPTTSSTSLVVTLPQVEFLKENDDVELIVTSDKKIVIARTKN